MNVADEMDDELERFMARFRELGAISEHGRRPRKLVNRAVPRHNPIGDPAG